VTPGALRSGSTSPRPAPLAPAGWQFSRGAIIARECTARLFSPLVRLLMRGPSVTGAEHLHEIRGPVLIAPNHQSHLDFTALRLAIGPAHRRRLAGAAAADYFAADHVRWFFAAWLGSFAFDRGAAGRRSSLEVAEGLLASGWHVLLFPEGTRSRTGDMGRFLPGIGLLATQTGASALPVRIRGTADALPKGRRLPRRARVSVAFGAPLTPLPGETARGFTTRLEAAVRAL
jgi:1-acyl-sn-glycerol-3-phosphate acyltransferase